MDKLYKKDTKGKIREWRLSVDDNVITSYSGIEGGVVKTSTTEVKETKTLSASEAAKQRADSQYSKKLKDGYFKTREKALAYEPSKVMLLHKYQDNRDKLPATVIVMPKLDGVCAKYVDSFTNPRFLSREDNPFTKLDSVASDSVSNVLTKILGTSRKLCDAHGELYAHGRTVSEIIEAIKGENEEVLKEIKFFMYDYMDADAEHTKYNRRLLLGAKRFAWDKTTGAFFLPVEFKVAHNKEQIELAHQANLKRDFEGSVICAPDGLYMYDRRTYNKLKYKNIFSEEFEITSYDSEDTNGKKLILFKCLTKSGAVFSVRPAWPNDRREEAYKVGDTFIGKKATVEYRSLTAYGLPFHPVLIAVRDYE